MNRKSGCKRVLACFLSLALLLPTVSGVVLADDSTDYSDAAVVSESSGTETTDSGQEEAVVADSNAGDETEQTSDDGKTETGTAETDSSTQQDGIGEPAPAEPEPTLDTDTNSLTTSVTSWNWVDPDGILQESSGVWGFGAAGASEENPLTREALLSLLPSQIEAETETGESVTLELIWDLSEVPEEGIWTGTISLAASLPEGYILAEGAAVPEVTLELGGGETYATSLPDAADIPYEDHIVEGVSPKGTTINLFDYWLTGRTDSDNSDEWEEGTLKNDRGDTMVANVPALQNQGINAEHAFLFGNGLSAGSSEENDPGYYGLWNTWTHTAKPRTGIVKNTLSDGYPVLNLNQKEVNEANYSKNGYYYYTLTNRNPSESLSYLFDPSEEHAGKTSFEEVEGLLQVDADGYFYYKSEQNYATFYAENNAFVLYDQPGVKSGGAAGNIGQFFPFNAANDVLMQRGDSLAQNGITSTDAKINHYFGLSMTTQFVQQYGGHVDEERTKAVTYEFSGDDDVWVFIDDVLVADLGGIHDALSLNINFDTGDIYVFGDRKNDQGIGDGQYNSSEDTLYEKSTLKEKYEAAGVAKNYTWDGNTYADNTYHTLKFFYLERGNVDSNLSLKFNLVTIPESGIIKVDQAGNHIAGAEFELYKADKNYDILDKNPICSGVTDSDGELIFVDNEGMLVSLDRLYNEKECQYLVLRETAPPSGYRSAGDMHLRFEVGGSGNVVLLSSNEWATGSYASSKVTVQTDSDISYSGASGSNHADLNDENSGTLFAVVLQRQNLSGELNDPGNWKAVSGDPEDGWKVYTDTPVLEGILAAAKDNAYTFEVTASGAYEATIENLPGDVTTYYYMLDEAKKETAQYTIGYYYTTASSISGATTDNTYLVNSDDFERVFSVNLYVANIQNNLYVQKLDENGEPVSATEGSATFALYKKEDVTISDSDGTYTIRQGAEPIRQQKTADLTSPLPLTGGVMFSKIPTGEYYLIEMEAPPGYVKSSAAVPVIVDNSGVYADAGTGTDGVSVRRGVGSVVRSMIQFATDDDIDTTLHDIKAELVSGTRTDSSGLAWNGWDGDETNDLHLQFENASKLLEYGAVEEDGVSYFDVETGWSKLLIRQCLTHQSDTGISSKKQNLGETDLTNLFSGTVTVRIENQGVGSLKITKRVSGDNVPENSEFTFAIVLTTGTSEDGGDYSAFVVDSNGEATEKEVKIENGVGTVTLQDGQSVQFDGIPVGTQFTVTEQDVPAGYTPSVLGDIEEGGSGNTASGVISHTTTNGVLDNTAEVLFTNTYSKAVTLTGETALKVQKTLEGRPLTESDKFQFTLTPNDETAQAIKNGKIQVADGYDSAAVEGTQEAETDIGTASFGTITFTEAGTYSFTIREVVPDTVTADNPILNGISYDTHPVTVAVTVTENPATGLLEASVTYDNGEALTAADQAKIDVAAFTNRIVGDFSFVKTDKDKHPLSGAVFAIYRLVCEDVSHTDHDTSLIEVSSAETGDIDPAYAYAGCWERAGLVTSDGGGNVPFTGLTINSEYRLVELKAPGGYVLPEGQWRITYDSETGSFEPMKGGAVGNPVAIGTDDEGNYYIENYHPTELPVSGFGGIQKFLLIGGTLMACGAAAGFGWYLHRGRKPAAEKSRKTRG